MSDFLARLALRATDTAAAVHPRPLGRFEPAAEPRAAISHDAGDAPASWPRRRPPETRPPLPSRCACPAAPPKPSGWPRRPPSCPAHPPRKPAPSAAWHPAC
jgi:hypothetical protein